MYFNKKCHLSPFKLIRYSLHEHTHDCKVKVQLGLSCWQGLGHSHSAFDLTLLRPLCCFCESWSSLACKRQRPSQFCQVKHDWKSLKQWLAQVKRNRSPIRICSRWFFIVLSLISQCRWCQSREPSVHFRQKWNGRWKLHSGLCGEKTPQEERCETRWRPLHLTGSSGWDGEVMMAQLPPYSRWVDLMERNANVMLAFNKQNLEMYSFRI